MKYDSAPVWLGFDAFPIHLLDKVNVMAGAARAILDLEDVMMCTQEGKLESQWELEAQKPDRNPTGLRMPTFCRDQPPCLTHYCFDFSDIRS